MKIRYTTDRVRYKTMTARELRDAFLVSDLFRSEEIHLEYCEVERAIVGSAVPAGKPLKLEAGKELSAAYFCERRELGVLNIGGGGVIAVDGNKYKMKNLDCLYIGRGSKEIVFESVSPNAPAKFYILSYPAHTKYPTTLIAKEDAELQKLGSSKEANVRTIHKCIHPGGVGSAQLVMGFTILDEGSVWNTMPPHTHERRSEVYMYFNMAADSVVFHLMGAEDETRHIIVRDGQAVVSPMWSTHSGVGTGTYAFCWGMGGENQAFSDMDNVSIKEMK